ncbi:hypothetical protein AB835_08675 [Candidatus Endobugula sertula]|uniref:Oxidoreductase n=1 Tax=Candidatus Endobugula sertula TaxID=62101 RepID=A0A1D2QPI3_9GAMM|nr:hypothetical protein AB835_08675 [Candidatus Endobugula sertula]
MRHAIIGAGFGVSVHLPAFANIKDVDVVGVSARSSNYYPQIPNDVVYYTDWRQMLDELQPDSLSVVVPPCSQREIVEEALQKGIHILCEKPFGVSLDDSKSLLLVKDACTIGAVGFQFRFEPAINMLRQKIRDNSIGRLNRMNMTWYTAGRADPNRPWSWQHDKKSGGGVINNFLTHLLDLVLWISNESIVDVVGSSQIIIPERKDHNGKTCVVSAEDSVDVILQLTSDITVNISINNCQTSATGMNITAYGDQGWLQFKHEPPFSVENVSLVLNRSLQESTSIPFNRFKENKGKKIDSRVAPTHALASLFVKSVLSSTLDDELPSFDDGVRVHQALTKLC